MKRVKDLYEKHWIDAGVILLVVLLVGGGLLMLKKSDTNKTAIEIVEPEGVSETNEVKGVVEEAEADSDFININTANQKELESLPGIGVKTAEKIVDFREENGGFGSVEDIMEVKGIGDGKFEDIEELISVE